MKILIINGPNLNLLGNRETGVYGNISFEEYFEKLKTYTNERAKAIELSYFQSNVEGEIINQLQRNEFSAFVLNAGGYSHTSVAIRDCIAAIQKEVIEVHISNLAAREEFRHNSLITAVCAGSIMGFGMTSYQLAIDYFITKIPKKLGY